MNPKGFFADSRNWFSVTSSNVHSVAHYYDPRSKLMILGVRFRPKGKGSVAEYWYYGASYSVFLSFMGSESKGRFVWRALRGRYRYQRVS